MASLINFWLPAFQVLVVGNFTVQETPDLCLMIKSRLSCNISHYITNPMIHIMCNSSNIFKNDMPVQGEARKILGRHGQAISVRQDATAVLQALLVAPTGCTRKEHVRCLFWNNQFLLTFDCFDTCSNISFIHYILNIVHVGLSFWLYPLWPKRFVLQHSTKRSLHRIQCTWVEVSMEFPHCAGLPSTFVADPLARSPDLTWHQRYGWKMKQHIENRLRVTWENCFVSHNMLSIYI